MKRIVFVWLLLLSSMGHAVQVSNLYSSIVQVPASLDDQQLLNRAFVQAIDDVLLRVSGKSDDLSSQVLAKAHRSVAGWVAQHSVQDVVETILGSDGPEAAKEVNVTFYKESVDRFLLDQGLPVWGSNRPSILVWLIEENSGSRKMFGANHPSAALSELFDGAKLHGLPVYAPLVDSVDKNALDSSALWGFFEEDILNASERYQTDIVLAIRVSQYRGEAVVESMLLAPNQSSRLVSVTNASKRKAMQEILLKLSALLSDRYASIRLATPNQLYVKVNGVNDYQAMSSLKNYLGSIGVVKQWQLSSVVGDQVEFNVSLNGTESKLRNSVALSSMLAALPVDPLEYNANRVINYQYTGKGNN
ncbi:DUF2066 domain-containing protein [Marinomonas atlantica]|uniref:DUF2066 domain-containing protein n=1 Tax=Marinomonas atlantica TaxID=1806668 RepID=UPI0009EDF4A1|nr:DUF2066 domain-containing protein [Marinomonas atlantica]MCO4785818.1 DUF2066 domain-containing protein [Marinomonas atlantica]